MNLASFKVLISALALVVFSIVFAGCGGGSGGGGVVNVFDRIAVITDQGPQIGVLTVAPNGTDVRVVIPGPTGGLGARFSPDGSKIVTVVGSGTASIFVVNSDGSAATTGLIGTNPAGNPAFSADGKSILYTDGTSLISVALNGNRRRVTPIVGVGGERFFTVVPSPDGAQLLVGVENLSGPNSNVGMAPLIAVVNPDGTGLHLIASGDASQANWSPDGSTIVYTSGHRIWKAPVSGGTPTQLTNTAGYDSVPVFSPDGTSILFASTRDTPGSGNPFDGSHLYKMNADGSNVTRLGGAGGELTGIEGLDWR